MDIISDVFDAIRPRGSLYFTADLRGSWAVEVPNEPATIRIHIVLQGPCYAKLTHNDEKIRLETGDVLIVNGGLSHVLADSPGRQPVALPRLLEVNPPSANGVLRYRGQGEQLVRLLCGSCNLGPTLEHPALFSFPNTVVLTQKHFGKDPWLAAVVNLMIMEANRTDLGMRGVLTRLFEALLIQVVRSSSLLGTVENSGFLKAISHKQLGQALKLMHQQPQERWTISLLAKEIGMSRSMLASKFLDAIGEPPITYLTRWRLLKARTMLLESNMTIEAIAQAAGYASLPSFTQRFKSAFGVSPGKFRRSASG